MTTSSSLAGYLVRYRCGQAPGHAVPGSTRFAFREAPARLTSRNPSLVREHYEPGGTLRMQRGVYVG